MGNNNNNNSNIKYQKPTVQSQQEQKPYMVGPQPSDLIQQEKEVIQSPPPQIIDDQALQQSSDSYDRTQKELIKQLNSLTKALEDFNENTKKQIQQD